MTGLELLAMPVFTMGSAIYFGVSQIRSLNGGEPKSDE